MRYFFVGFAVDALNFLLLLLGTCVNNLIINMKTLLLRGDQTKSFIKVHRPLQVISDCFDIFLIPT